ncbi:hypothetical protein F4777DRAFT_64442 [Nemania sp. FL0916]|nr:hypothetical protein F4777DRAFT_64442 [Nemania sp. FL0916]
MLAFGSKDLMILFVFLLTICNSLANTPIPPARLGPRILRTYTNYTSINSTSATRTDSSTYLSTTANYTLSSSASSSVSDSTTFQTPDSISSTSPINTLTRPSLTTNWSNTSSHGHTVTTPVSTSSFSSGTSFSWFPTSGNFSASQSNTVSTTNTESSTSSSPLSDTPSTIWNSGTSSQTLISNSSLSTLSTLTESSLGTAWSTTSSVGLSFSSSSSISSISSISITSSSSSAPTSGATDSPTSSSNGLTESTQISSSSSSSLSSLSSSSGASHSSSSDSQELTASTDTASTTDLAHPTGFPSFTTPTVTLTSSPAESSEAVTVAPILFYLWSKRSLIQDKQQKNEYIDNVKKSRDDILAVLDKLKEKPEPKPECRKKSLTKRSLISGILGLFQGIADLISCTVAVLDNLVDAVKQIDPPIPEIELLTDTLKDLGDELDRKSDEHSTLTSSHGSSSTYSSSSSSCTLSITKTWESVLCTVTATSSGNKRRQDQDCTTELYTTVTGCSAIESTITSTTTIEPTPTARCGFNSCGGGGLCPREERGLQKRQPPRISEPEPNTWAGPENYGGSNQNFMAGESWRAYHPTDIFSRGVKTNVRGTTSNEIGFLGNTGSLAVSGLYGCTSVVVVSRRGAWINHMWEAPFFTPYTNDPAPPSPLEQQDIFRKEALMPLLQETGPDNSFGISDMRVITNGPEFPTSHLMEDDADPRVFIFAPYERLGENDPEYNNEFPKNLPEAWGMDDGLPSFNQQIENEIRAIFRAPSGYNVPIEKVLYAPLQSKKGDRDLLVDPLFKHHRGKALVQYQPALKCGDMASWRVWFEGHELTSSHQASWAPTALQKAYEDEVVMKKRQDSNDTMACPSPSSPTTTISTAASSLTITVPSSSASSSPASSSSVSSSSLLSATLSSISSSSISSSSVLSSTISSFTLTSTISSTDSGISSTVTTSASSADQDTSSSLSSDQPPLTTSTSALSSDLSSDQPPSTTSTSTSSLTTSFVSFTEPLPSELSTVPPETDLDPTTTASPEATPTSVALKLFDLVCNDELDFPRHEHLNPVYVLALAKRFSEVGIPEGGYMNSSSPKIHQAWTDNEGLLYEFSVEWIPSCVTQVDKQEFSLPIGNNDLGIGVEQIMVGNYENCLMEGSGGSTQVGCLKYSFSGGY